jgi:Protein of unknown function (DUF2695)
MTESDRDRKKALKRQFKGRERADADARLPLPKPDLAELFDRLDDRLSAEDCDHTLRHTEAFLTERGFDVATVVTWLRESGGYCDCEVLANVEDQWADRL